MEMYRKRTKTLETAHSSMIADDSYRPSLYLNPLNGQPILSARFTCKHPTSATDASPDIQEGDEQITLPTPNTRLVRSQGHGGTLHTPAAHHSTYASPSAERSVPRHILVPRTTTPDGRIQPIPHNRQTHPHHTVIKQQNDVD